MLSLPGYSLVRCTQVLSPRIQPQTLIPNKTGFVLFTITRECLYYIGIRQAYLSSPHQAKRISSRTVLITSVPKQYLDERRLRKLYGDSVKRVWIPRTSKALVKAVEEREQTAMRLEKAEIKLIRKANIARTKQLKKNPPPEPPPTVPSSPNLSRTSGTESEQLQSSTTQEVQVIDDARSNASNPQAQEGFRPELTKTARLTGTSHDLLEKSAEDPDYVHPYGLGVSIPDVRGSVAAQWIPAEARPYHRPLHNFFRRVDTVRWCRMRLKELNTDIYKLRKQVKRGECDALPAAFIEFDTQEAAQAAHQVVAHHRPLQLAPRILGVRPDEIVWTALRMRWWERIIRRFFILGLVTAAVIFWSIPTAVIGFLSNIEFLSNIFFLQWLRLLPKVIIGFLQRFVPAIVLTFWMSLVPAMLRCRSSTLPWRLIANLASLRHPSRYSISRHGRTVHPERLLCFPGRPGLSNHHADFGCLGRVHRHHQGSHLGKGPTRPESSKSFQLLPLIHPGSVPRRRCHRNLASV